MDRREAIKTATGAGLALLVGAAHAQSQPAAHDHAHHMHHAAVDNLQALIEATGTCINKGELCLAHCLVLLGDGDKAMAECAKSVNQMLVACRALNGLAAQGSRLTAAQAKIALDACSECEKACKKHADKHAECKACLEACIECGKQCKALSA